MAPCRCRWCGPPRRRCCCGPARGYRWRRCRRPPRHWSSRCAPCCVRGQQQPRNPAAPHSAQAAARGRPRPTASARHCGRRADGPSPGSRPPRVHDRHAARTGGRLRAGRRWGGRAGAPVWRRARDPSLPGSAGVPAECGARQRRPLRRPSFRVAHGSAGAACARSAAEQRSHPRTVARLVRALFRTVVSQHSGWRAAARVLHQAATGCAGSSPDDAVPARQCGQCVPHRADWPAPQRTLKAPCYRAQTLGIG